MAWYHHFCREWLAHHPPQCPWGCLCNFLVIIIVISPSGGCLWRLLEPRSTRRARRWPPGPQRFCRCSDTPQLATFYFGSGASLRKIRGGLREKHHTRPSLKMQNFSDLGHFTMKIAKKCKLFFFQHWKSGGQGARWSLKTIFFHE